MRCMMEGVVIDNDFKVNKETNQRRPVTVVACGRDTFTIDGNGHKQGQTVMVVGDLRIYEGKPYFRGETRLVARPAEMTVETVAAAHAKPQAS